ncbi:hypothetical protein [Nesterenkonia ebinurensis]|uniref:hypothetical protein n=1 Tax=Nesterenkonia ebinurensis TaxID=2608252 RepID=UPI00123CA1D6|nr:hypothetical protein [Nesterenkonia ebinurensis]
MKVQVSNLETLVLFPLRGVAHGDSHAGIVSIALRVDRAHPELITMGMAGSKLADQQRQAFLLVPPIEVQRGWHARL